MNDLTNSEQKRAILRQFDELVRTGDPADLEALCTPDMVNHALAKNRPAGLEGTRQFLRECREDPRRAAWTESLTHASQRLVVDGDWVAQFAVVNAVWPGGMFRGIRTESGPYETDAAFLYRFADGRIAERWAVRDDLGMLLQLGGIERAS